MEVGMCSQGFVSTDFIMIHVLFKSALEKMFHLSLSVSI